MSSKFADPSGWVGAGIQLFDWLAERAKEVLVIFLLSLLAWLLKFLPSEWLFVIGINPANPVYREWVLGALWGSFLYLVVFGGAEKWRQFDRKFHLRHLADDEKILLQGFVTTNCLTRQFQAWVSGLGSLVEDKILVIDRHVAQQDRDGGVFVCRLRTWAFRYLKKNSHFVGLAPKQSTARK